jgi:tetratricopeptide (TPR) repeat protein
LIAEPGSSQFYETLGFTSMKNYELTSRSSYESHGNIIEAYAGVSFKKIIDAFSTVYEQNQQKLLPLLYLADLTTKETSIDRAIFYHNKALELTNNQELKARILYQLSVLYYEQGEYHKMLSQLERIEQSEISYAPADNLHAYYYATKGKKRIQS